MDALEAAAGLLRVRRLSLQASLTAQGFYALVTEGTHGGERTLVMAKDLPVP